MERTGEELLDRLIARFARQNRLLRDERYACGRCVEASERFLGLLAEAGIGGWLLNERPDLLGYSDRRQESYYAPGKSYSHHSVVVSESLAGLFLVDWSAAQFGYSEFPLVQRVSSDGTIERNWPLADWQPWPQGLFEYGDGELESFDELMATSPQIRKQSAIA